jgi:hypothetical protein
LGALKDKIGDDLLILPYTDNFDVLDSFEKILGLTNSEFVSLRNTLPSTAKLSAKAQAALLRLNHICEGYPININRHGFLQAVVRGDISFADDYIRYTLLSTNVARAIREDAINVATAAGIAEYTSAFEYAGDSVHPLVVLDSALTEQDISVIREYLMSN